MQRVTVQISNLSQKESGDAELFLRVKAVTRISGETELHFGVVP